MAIFLLAIPTLAGSAMAAGLAVRVTPVAGEPYAAELEAITAETLTLLVAGESKSVPRAEITRIEATEPAAIQGPTVSVGLADGSRLKAEGFRIEGSEATLELRRQEPLEVPVRGLRWVRFRPPSPTIDNAWLGLLGDDRAEDMLVIRRSAETIDQVNGVVIGADATTVRFSVGDQEVPAPVARLEGIVFGGSAAAGEAESSGITVVDTLGSQWAVRSLTLASVANLSAAERAEGVLEMEILDGQQRSLRLDQLDSIRFEGNTQLLAAESPVESQYTPLVQLPIDQPRLLRWLGPRVEGDRDLILRSRSSVTYRVDPKFGAFATRIAPDASVAAGGGCDVRILVDGEVVWNETVLPSDAPRGVELDLGSARRVTLEVDYGDGEGRSDAGDVIRFIEPRLLQ
ncbi:NPCBM/NEW2 domain-containing protein [Candidatus Laterigemmans baculatus]|uniref:NPCBM/NEW2 domain-containing protein n=1 Tax=Candidatus Laterigemmans baculatus TaxID=2770505 RepID=UPI0013DD5E0E|nr:NPCBM/NEW2 domain-containing protein [Candidatus Laterigemmans baculatus]